MGQRFDARDSEKFEDQGYGAFINRLNAALSYKRFTLGTRLDSSVYWLKPEDRPLPDSVGADAPTAADREDARVAERLGRGCLHARVFVCEGELERVATFT